MITEDSALRDRTGVFSDRVEGGAKLAALLAPEMVPDALVLAIPSGGVPVAVQIGKRLKAPLDLLVVRKVQIPWNTEAGFGAVNLDGDFIVNESVLLSLNLSDAVIRSQVTKAMAVLARRNALFRRSADPPFMEKKDIILADDGLASGYTMLAAVACVKKRNPASITVAAPTGSLDTVLALEKKVDRVLCANIRGGYPFAVASAYREWHDLTDEEVLGLLNEEGGPRYAGEPPL